MDRLHLRRTCIREGAKDIYRSEKFKNTRLCMFTFQLDMGSLATWQYCLRNAVKDLSPGSAALCDVSWKGTHDSIEGTT